MCSICIPVLKKRDSSPSYWYSFNCFGSLESKNTYNCSFKDNLEFASRQGCALIVGISLNWDIFGYFFLLGSPSGGINGWLKVPKLPWGLVAQMYWSSTYTTYPWICLVFTICSVTLWEAWSVTFALKTKTGIQSVAPSIVHIVSTRSDSSGKPCARDVWNLPTNDLAQTQKWHTDKEISLHMCCVVYIEQMRGGEWKSLW